MKTWLKAAIILAAVWIVAGTVIYFARAAKPTEESTARFIQAQNMAAKSAADRQKALVKAADLLNRLSAEDRQQLRHEGITSGFFKTLTPDEQGQFLDLTLPVGFKEMMDAFNKMDGAKRKQIVQRAIHGMEQRKDQDGGDPRMNDQNTQRIIDQGLKSFYSEANADTKLDLAPFIDEVQHTIQTGGGAPHGGGGNDGR